MWFVSAEVYPRWFTLTITRSLAQGSACKDLGRNDQSPGHHVQGRLHSDPLPRQLTLTLLGGLYHEV